MMKRIPRWSRVLLLCLPAAFLAPGCGPSGPPRYKITGQVVLNGQPLTVKPGGPPGDISIKVQLLPDVGDPSKPVDPKEAAYDQATGKFTAVGPDGKGIEAGKYRVAVYQYDPYPTDKLNGKFSREKTPVSVEVKGAQELAPIELNQYK